MSVQLYCQRHFSRILTKLMGLGVMLMVLMIQGAFAAEGSHAFSLVEAQKFAVDNNYDTLKSQMDVTVTEKKIRETVGAGLPQISTSLGYTNNIELVTMLIPDFFNDPNDMIEIQFGTQHNATLNLQVQQLVFNGSYFVGLATSRIFKRLATEGLKRTKLDVMETVSQTYYLILVSQESEKIIQGNLQNLEKTLYEIRELYKEGFLEETDADVIQISVYSLSYMAQRNKFSFLNFDEKWYRSQVVGVNLNIPVFRSGTQKARVQQASVALDQAHQTTLQVSQGLLLGEAQAKNALSAAYENYINVKDNMELSKKVYDKTLIKYQEGMASSTDLTQANDRHLAVQASYIQALSELLGAKNALDRLRNDYQVSTEG